MKPSAPILLAFFVFLSINKNDGKNEEQRRSEDRGVTRRQKRAPQPPMLKATASVEFLSRMSPSKGKSKKSNENEGKGKILFFADDFYYSHFRFNLLLADILHEDGYEVHFIYAHHEETSTKMRPKNKFLFVEVPLKLPTFDEIRDEDPSFFNAYYEIVGIYQAIVENTKVQIEGKRRGIYEWLMKQQRKQPYDLAMAEFSTGAFGVFHQLQIERWIALAAIPPQPHLLHYLGIDTSSTPVYYQLAPGDGRRGLEIEREGSTLNMANKEKYRRNIEWYQKMHHSDYRRHFAFAKQLRQKAGLDNFQLAEMPPLDQLFGQAKAYVVNQHEMAKYESVPLSPLVAYIGGVDVEAQEVLTRKNLDDHSIRRGEDDCVVLFNLGTVVQLQGEMDRYGMMKMLRTMALWKGRCRFIVRINRHYVPYNFNAENIKIYGHDEMIPQQEILAQNNVKLFISHCGMNSMNEAIYAGVLLLCVPFKADQPYNASIVEYLGIGVWLPRTEFYNQFDICLAHMLQENSSFQTNALNLARRIRDQMRDRNRLKRNIFLRVVHNVINGGGHGSGGGESPSLTKSRGGRYPEFHSLYTIGDSRRVESTIGEAHQSIHPSGPSGKTQMDTAGSSSQQHYRHIPSRSSVLIASSHQQLKPSERIDSMTITRKSVRPSEQLESMAIAPPSTRPSDRLNLTTITRPSSRPSELIKPNQPSAQVTERQSLRPSQRLDPKTAHSSAGTPEEHSPFPSLEGQSVPHSGRPSAHASKKPVQSSAVRRSTRPSEILAQIDS